MVASRTGSSGHGPDGRTALVMPPVAFLRRARTHRCIEPNVGEAGELFRTSVAKARGRLRALVPARDDAVAPRCAAAPTGSRRVGRLPWADLLRRVFADDVLLCTCGGRRSIIAVVADPTLARTLLAAIGLHDEPAAFAPARAPPQVELAWENPPWPTDDLVGMAWSARTVPKRPSPYIRAAARVGSCSATHARCSPVAAKPGLYVLAAGGAENRQHEGERHPGGRRRSPLARFWLARRP
jgi:hypothetical protein